MRNFFKKRRMAAVADDAPTMTPAAPTRTPAAERPAPAERTVGGPPKLRPIGGLAVAAGNAARGEPTAGRAAADPAASADTELPRFSIPVAGGLRSAAGREPALLRGMSPEVNGLLREAFTPTRPKQRLNSLFIGRTATLRRIISAIEEERAHVILFGDRGRGKTSLANAVEQIAAQAGYMALKQTCSSELTFEEIFRHFLKKIPSTYFRSTSGSAFTQINTFQSFAELLPRESFSVTELNEVLGSIHGTHVLMILDEYDRVTDEDFRNKLAELFKNLSDSSINVTLLVVGVAENLDQLLGKHPSIQRALVPVHLPLMSDREVERLLQAGAGNAKIAFSNEVLRRIVDFARGLPYYAQLLGLHSARSAVSRRSDMVERDDLVYAVSRCLQEAERGVVVSYARALAPEHRSEMEDVLLAAALCPSDEFGIFDPMDLAAPGGTVSPTFTDRLRRLIDDEYGAVLVPALEPGRVRYRFQNQMMRQYVLMRQAQERGQI